MDVHLKRLIFAVIFLKLAGCSICPKTSSSANCKVQVHDGLQGIHLRSGFHGEMVKLFYCNELVLQKRLTTDGSTSSASWVAIKDKSNAPMIRIEVEAGGREMDSEKKRELQKLYEIYKEIPNINPPPIKTEIHGRLVKEFRFSWKNGPVVEVSVIDGEICFYQTSSMELIY